MPPLHRLDFALWVPVVNPRFVPNNNLPQKLDGQTQRDLQTPQM